jgi:hypothetical protein
MTSDTKAVADNGMPDKSTLDAVVAMCRARDDRIAKLLSECEALREQLVEAKQREDAGVAGAKGFVQGTQELIAELRASLAAREKDVLVMNEAIADIRAAILCPVSRVASPEQLLPIISAAIERTADSVAAIEQRIRDSALEEAAIAMHPMLRDMISRGKAAELIRSLKTSGLASRGE